MAGKRQHFLPRFLLSGFPSRSAGKQCFCYVYRKDGTSFEANINNVGVEGYFYGEPGEGSADEKITSDEGHYADLLENLRIKPSQSEINKSEVAKFIAHLTVRTRHVRKEITSAVERMFDDILQTFSDPEVVRNFAIHQAQTDPSRIKKDVESELKKRGIKLTSAQKRVHFHRVQKAVIHELKNKPTAYFNGLAVVLKPLAAHIATSSKAGHIQAIEKSSSPEPRQEVLAKLRWQFTDFPNNSLILGDVGPWAICNRGDTICSLAWAPSEIEVVILPISHSRVLVGTATNPAHPLSAEFINSQSALLSSEFFILSDLKEVNAAYSSMLGQKATEVLDEAVKEAGESLRSELGISH